MLITGNSVIGRLVVCMPLCLAVAAVLYVCRVSVYISFCIWNFLFKVVMNFRQKGFYVLKTYSNRHCQDVIIDRHIF